MENILSKYASVHGNVIICRTEEESIEIQRLWVEIGGPDYFHTEYWERTSANGIGYHLKFCTWESPKYFLNRPTEYTCIEASTLLASRELDYPIY